MEISRGAGFLCQGREGVEKERELEIKYETEPPRKTESLRRKRRQANPHSLSFQGLMGGASSSATGSEKGNSTWVLYLFSARSPLRKERKKTANQLDQIARTFRERPKDTLN